MLVWINGEEVLYETSRERAELRFRITRDPDREYTDEQWEKIHGMVRVIDGNVVEGYTEQELKEQKRSIAQAEIAELKEKLLTTDYIAAKIAEGAATKEEYAEQLTKRQQWRDRINELEESLNVAGNK